MTATLPDEPPARLITFEVLALMGAAMFFFVAFGMTVPLLPAYVTQTLGGDNLDVGLIVGVVAIPAILVRPWIVPRINRWGAKRVIIIAGLLGSVSLALYALPADTAVLGGVRLLTGAAQACLMVSAVSSVTASAPVARRGQAAAYMSIGPYLGLGIGPVLGQLISQGSSIETAFLWSGIVGMVGLPPVFFTNSNRAINSEANKGGPRMSARGILPGAVLMLGMFGVVGMQAFIPLFAPRELGIEPHYPFTVYATMLIFVRLFGNSLSLRLGLAKTSVIATILIAAGLSLIGASYNPAMLFVGTVVLASGVAFQYPCLISIALLDVQPRAHTATIATFTMFLDVATGLGGPLAGSLAFGHNYRLVFFGGAASAILGLFLLLTLVLPRAGLTSGAVPKK